MSAMNKLLLILAFATGCATLPVRDSNEQATDHSDIYRENGRWPGSPVVKTLLGGSMTLGQGGSFTGTTGTFSGALTALTITLTGGSGAFAVQVPSNAKIQWASSSNYINVNSTTFSFVSNGAQILTFDRTGPSMQGFAMGTGTTGYDIGGNVTTITTPVASSGAGSTLMTFSLPASSLTSSNRCVVVTAWGHATNDANAKTVSLAFGGTTAISKQLNVSLASPLWKLSFTACRTGTSAQQVWGEGWNSDAIAVSNTDGPTILYFAKQTSATETETSAIVIKGVATTATTTGITQDGMQVFFQ